MEHWAKIARLNSVLIILFILLINLLIAKLKSIGHLGLSQLSREITEARSIRLRILPGKKHRKIKLHALMKNTNMDILGRWYIKLTLFKRY